MKQDDALADEQAGERHTEGAAPGGSLSRAQRQTRDAFSYKWRRRDSYDHAESREFSRRWLLDRYCGGGEALLDDWLPGPGNVVVDAGCGAGFSALLLFGGRLYDQRYIGFDVSDAVEVARERFTEAGLAGEFLRGDVGAPPIAPRTADIVLAEGVLHHTDEPREAFHALARLVRPGGRLLFYVYARKAVIREFVDDYVRKQLSRLDDEQAWQALEPLSRLGQALGELDVKLTVPADVELLGIKQGTYDLQRFFYWHICKAYYRPEYSTEMLNHVNFDWYRPANCHRFTVQEVQEWCASAAFRIESLRQEEAGITVVARRATEPDAS